MYRTCGVHLNSQTHNSLVLDKSLFYSLPVIQRVLFFLLGTLSNLGRQPLGRQTMARGNGAIMPSFRAKVKLKQAEVGSIRFRFTMASFRDARNMLTAAM